MSSEVYTISTAEAIVRIKKVIENQQGDRGRLEFISEALQKGKRLFHSDQRYLKQKILADVTPNLIKKPTEKDRKIRKVKRLISLNLGEPERLRHILHCLENNRTIYHSDEKYIEAKTEQFLQFSEGRRLKRRLKTPSEPISEQFQEPLFVPSPEMLREKQAEPTQDLPERLEEIEEAVLSTKPKKTVDLIDLLEDSSQVNLGIEKERQKISKLKNDHQQLKIQRDELSKLIAYRQEYEIKINREREILEKEIKIEQSKVTEKDKLVEELIKNQSMIIQAKSEKEVLLEQIKIEKAQSDLDLKREQEELEKVKIEYEKLQKEISEKKQAFNKKIKEQQRIQTQKLGFATTQEELEKTTKKETDKVVKKPIRVIEEQKYISESDKKLEKLKTDFDEVQNSIKEEKEIDEEWENLKNKSEELRDSVKKETDKVEKSTDLKEGKDQVDEAKKKLDKLKTDFDDE